MNKPEYRESITTTHTLPHQIGSPKKLSNQRQNNRRIHIYSTTKQKQNQNLFHHKNRDITVSNNNRMSQFLHQRPIQNPFTQLSSSSDSQQQSSSSQQKPRLNLLILCAPTTLLALLTLIFLLGFTFPYTPSSLFSSHSHQWKSYTLEEAASFVATKGNGTVIVCAVSLPYLPFLNNWLISVSRQKHADQVLVIAEDYDTLFKVNRVWPGHAVLVPPAPPQSPSQSAHKFGSQGFFNFTSRRPRHLLQLLELGYNVMYNDVDMVWLGDPFPYMQGLHDVYFTDDMAAVKPLNHSHELPPPNKKGRTYICSCMIYMHPTDGAKLVLKKWIEELQDQPWSKTKKSNDQPAFNWALNKTAGQVDLYLLPQAAFPTGGLYFKNKTWVEETKGKHVIIHNNYILGFEKKIKRFREYGLWYVDDHFSESPLGRIE